MVIFQMELRDWKRKLEEKMEKIKKMLKKKLVEHS